MAVRVALGASRWRVVAQVLHQAFLLASAGAVVGILLATVALAALNRWITAAATSPLPFWMEVTLGGAALLFVLGAVGVSVLAAGLFPALRAQGPMSTELSLTCPGGTRPSASEVKPLPGLFPDRPPG